MNRNVIQSPLIPSPSHAYSSQEASWRNLCAAHLLFAPDRLLVRDRGKDLLDLDLVAAARKVRQYTRQKVTDAIQGDSVVIREFLFHSFRALPKWQQEMNAAPVYSACLVEVANGLQDIISEHFYRLPGYRLTYFHLLRFRLGLLRDLYGVAKHDRGIERTVSETLAPSGGLDVQYREAIDEWLGFCLDDKNRAYFSDLTDDPGGAYDRRELEVQRVLFAESDGKLDPTKWNPFFEEEGADLLEYLLPTWFLRQYDLKTGRQVVRRLTRQPTPRPLQLVLLKATGAVVGLIEGRVFLLLVLFLLMAGGPRLWLAFTRGEPVLPTLVPHSLPLFNLSESLSAAVMVRTLTLPLATGATLVVIAVVLLTSLAVSQGVLWFRILVPRLLGGLILGYLPLMMTDEMWRSASLLSWVHVAVIAFAAIASSYLFLYVETRNVLVSADWARRRAVTLLTMGIVESLALGLLICEATTTIYAAVNPEIVSREPIFIGLLGIVNIKVLMLWAPVALLIGIFVQLIWEDKPITQPL